MTSSVLQRADVESTPMESALVIFRRRRVFDLFCCEGGASTGYHRAGWDVYGCDLFQKNTRRRYPFAAYTGDAIVALEMLLAGHRLPFTHPDGRVEWLGLDDFDAIVGSPPCQAYTRANTHVGRTRHARLIAVVRDLLIATGKPYVIENVEQALSEMVDPIVICGRMFALTAPDTDGVRLILERHRLFESNVPLTAPPHPAHTVRAGEFIAGVYGGARKAKKRVCVTNDDGTLSRTMDDIPEWWSTDANGRPMDEPGWTLTYITPTAAEDRYAARIERGGGYVPRDKSVREALLGIDWMTGEGLQESIPPVYAEHIGRQLLTHVMELAA